MSKLKVMSIFGTRPEAIKMAPLVKKLEKYDKIESLVAVTAQHREMLDSVLKIFKIKPDYDLDIMEPGQSLSTITSKALLGIEKLLVKESPDLVLVHGDTSTTFSGALAAFYQQIPVGHVEAGLRSFSKYSPFPEEINRCMTGKIAELHFAPTLSNAENLKAEGIKDNIFICGNTVIDAMKYTVSDDYVFETELLNKLDFKGSRIITLTCHRRENYGQPLENIFLAVREIAEKYEDVQIVDPVHLSPVVRTAAQRILGGLDRVHLIEPVTASEMHNLMARSHMVLTDSGGLQEEAPALGRPVLVLRRETERPEAIAAGTVKMAGTDRERIVELTSELLDSETAYKRMARAVNPYGDGRASERIAQSILWHFGLSGKKPESFSP